MNNEERPVYGYVTYNLNNERWVAEYRVKEFIKLLSEKDAEIQQLKSELALLEKWKNDTLNDLVTYKAHKDKEIQELKDWKESAMSVWPDMQKIGELIGVKLGGSVHDKIIPAIEKMQAEIQHLKSSRVKGYTHDEVERIAKACITEAIDGMQEFIEKDTVILDKEGGNVLLDAVVELTKKNTPSLMERVYSRLEKRGIKVTSNYSPLTVNNKK